MIRMFFVQFLDVFPIFYIFPSIFVSWFKTRECYMKKHNEWTKRTTLLRRVLLILVSFLLIGVDINASYSLRQFSSKNGLSNSAILSMCQDRHGVIWIGSCDGLNIYDGTYLGLYKPTNVHHSFSGNLIERIIEADNDVLWICLLYTSPSPRDCS